jgi:hypothetical protein
MYSIKEIIIEQLELAKMNIANNMVVQNRRASGRSIAEMKIQADDTKGVLIDGAGYLFASEYGSRPSQKTTRPPKAMVDSIERWTLIKGITAANGNQRSLAYAISTKILKEGNVLYRSGKNSGVITEAVNQEWLNDTAAKFGDYYVSLIKSEVIRNTSATVI